MDGVDGRRRRFLKAALRRAIGAPAEKENGKKKTRSKPITLGWLGSLTTRVAATLRRSKWQGWTAGTDGAIRPNNSSDAVACFNRNSIAPFSSELQAISGLRYGK
jgi:hypothetical protein